MSGVEDTVDNNNNNNNNDNVGNNTIVISSPGNSPGSSIANNSGSWDGDGDGDYTTPEPQPIRWGIFNNFGIQLFSREENRGRSGNVTNSRPAPPPFGIHNPVSNSQSFFLEEVSEPKANGTQSEDNSSKRARKGEDEIQNDVCSICLDRWGNSGPHQIASTKCGHLFGKSCILRWINTNNSDFSKCPTCNQKVNRNDIHPLFVGNLAVRDQTELDNLQKIVREKEHALARTIVEANSYLHSNRKANAQIAFLESQLNILKRRKTCDQENNPSSYNGEVNYDRSPVFALDLKYRLSNSASMPTRSLAYVEGHDMLLVGKQTGLESQGVLAISQLSNSLNAQKTITLGHQSQIKNIKTFTTSSGVVLSLSVGMDCNLVYRKHTTAGKSHYIHSEILYSFKLPNKVFSCCFHTENPNIFYAAGMGGSIYHFNLSIKTDGPVVTYQPPVLKGPTIIFLDCLPREGFLVVATLKGVFLSKLTFEDQCIWNIEQFISGDMGIFSVSHIGNQIYLFSLRHMSQSYVEHRIAKLERISVHSVQSLQSENGQSLESGYEFSFLNSYTNPGSQLNMTQTAAFQNPSDPNHFLIASPGHKDNSVIVRTVTELESHTDTIPIPNSETVNHIAFIRLQKKRTFDGDFYLETIGASPMNTEDDIMDLAGEEIDNEINSKPQNLVTDALERSLINIRLLILTNQSVYLYKIHHNQ